MMCQGFLSQDELVQLVRDIEISTVLLGLGINTTKQEKWERTNVGHERRVKLLCFQLWPIDI